MAGSFCFSATRLRCSVVVVVDYRPHQHGEDPYEDQCYPPMGNSKRDGEENNDQPEPPWEPLFLCGLLDHLAPSKLFHPGNCRLML
jgi:hypothetical protein